MWASVRGTMHPIRDVNNNRYTAENHGEENTSNMYARSSNGAKVGLSSKYWFTRCGLTLRWGKNAPGRATTASSSNSSSATRILVSCRQLHRNQPRRPRPLAGGVGRREPPLEEVPRTPTGENGRA